MMRTSRYLIYCVSLSIPLSVDGLLQSEEKSPRRDCKRMLPEMLNSDKFLCVPLSVLPRDDEVFMFWQLL